MKKVKVFSLNKEGKIEFTKAELEKLLNETYDEGYQEGLGKQFTWSPPYYNEVVPYLNATTTTNTYDLKINTTDNAKSI